MFSPDQNTQSKDLVALSSLKIRVPSLAELDHMHIRSSGHICWGCFYLDSAGIIKVLKRQGNFANFFPRNPIMNYLTKYAVNNFVFKNKFVRYNPPYRATQSFELYSLNQSVIFTILRLLIAQESALHSFPISALSLFLYSFTSSSLPSAFVWCVLSSYNYISSDLLRRALVPYALAATAAFLSFLEARSFYGFHIWMRCHSFFLCIFMCLSLCAWLVSLKIMFSMLAILSQWTEFIFKPESHWYLCAYQFVIWSIR